MGPQMQGTLKVTVPYHNKPLTTSEAKLCTKPGLAE